MSNINGEITATGRGNIAPNTINIVRLAILAKKDINKFFTLFNEKIELAKNQLLHRYDVLKKLKVADLPFAAGQGLMVGSEGLKENDSIEPILKQGT
jgi:ribonucleoside-triphosphate reductase